MKLFETKKTAENDSSSSSEDDVEMILRDTDDDTSHQSEEVETNELTIGSVLKINIEINAFILVEFKCEKTGRPTYYVAKVLANPQSDHIEDT